eukprot:gene21504-12563_t
MGGGQGAKPQRGVARRVFGYCLLTGAAVAALIACVVGAFVTGSRWREVVLPPLGLYRMLNTNDDGKGMPLFGIAPATLGAVVNTLLLQQSQLRSSSYATAQPDDGSTAIAHG